MSLETWIAFFLACLLISLTPGAGALASMTSGMNYGFRTGYWNALGLQLALVVQVALVAAGLGALLAASEMAFTLIKWCGVAYLAYLGWKQWSSPPAALSEEKQTASQPPISGLILRGFLVNASNPKAIIFILAILPQFLDPARPLLEQYLLMLATMTAVDLLVMAGYTGLAAKVLRLLRQPSHQIWMNRAFGGTFMGAALLMSRVQRD
ncbi:LysE family translocator [Marinospirillum perlucidum]|uniref:LysE family translocator n=1 Tax=Marinospirillum perlucidum TaxID=1982602 RepID=UPI000DF1C760|nr:LysE family transporter [Marinospirillum perlucidum]